MSVVYGSNRFGLARPSQMSVQQAKVRLVGLGYIIDILLVSLKDCGVHTQSVWVLFTELALRLSGGKGSPFHPTAACKSSDLLPQTY